MGNLQLCKSQQEGENCERKSQSVRQSGLSGNNQSRQFISQKLKKIKQLNPSFEIKILVAGDKSVGKSTFVDNIIRNQFYNTKYTKKINPTFGMEFHKHQIEMYGESINLRISDMPGGIRSMLQVGSYANKYDLIFLCFTYNDEGQSLYNCLKYLEFLRRIKNDESVSRQFSMADSDFSQSNLADLQNLIIQSQEQDSFKQKLLQQQMENGSDKKNNNFSNKSKNELIINSTGNYDNILLIGIHKENKSQLYSVYKQKIVEEKSFQKSENILKQDSENLSSDVINELNQTNNNQNKNDLTNNETSNDDNNDINNSDNNNDNSTNNNDNNDINKNNNNINEKYQESCESSNVNSTSQKENENFDKVEDECYKKQTSDESQLRNLQKQKIDLLLNKIITNFEGIQYIDYSQNQNNSVYKDMNIACGGGTLNDNLQHVFRNFLTDYKPQPVFN